MIYVIISVVFLFMMTTLGASGVLLNERNEDSRIGEYILSISIGIMIATATFALLVPAMELREGIPGFFQVVFGFLGGCFILLLLDKITDCELRAATRMKSFMFAMTLHNIPEGITVALAFNVWSLNPQDKGLLIAAITLSAGIAVQNVPESFALAMTIKNAGYSKVRAFVYSMLTGVVEPIFGIMACIMNNQMKSFMPFLLAYAAGTMLHITVEELIPDIMGDKNRALPTFGIMTGILCMIIMEMVQ